MIDKSVAIQDKYLVVRRGKKNILLYALEVMMKKNKKEIKKEQKKVLKLLKIIIGLCIAIIVIELGYIGLSYYNRNKSIIIQIL